MTRNDSMTQKCFETSATMFPCHSLTTDHLKLFAILSRFSAVVFSSMTSLQKEEFFDLVATAQARRLDDQRAQLGGSMPPKPKARSFRGSIKQLSFVKKPTPAPEPAPAPKEDLYDMILTTQVSNTNLFV